MVASIITRILVLKSCKQYNTGDNSHHRDGETMKYVPTAVRRDLRLMGERLSQQRRLLSLTVADVAKRAGVSPTTVANIEQGKAVRTDSLLSVARILQMADGIVSATNPYLTDLGRLRANDRLPKRVRRRITPSDS